MLIYLLCIYHYLTILKINLFEFLLKSLLCSYFINNFVYYLLIQEHYQFTHFIPIYDFYFK